MNKVRIGLYSVNNIIVHNNNIIRYIIIIIVIDVNYPVPRKWYGSADCDTLYTNYPSVHKQLTRTLFEAHIVFINKFQLLPRFRHIHCCTHTPVHRKNIIQLKSRGLNLKGEFTIFDIVFYFLNLVDSPPEISKNSEVPDESFGC